MGADRHAPRKGLRPAWRFWLAACAVGGAAGWQLWSRPDLPPTAAPADTPSPSVLRGTRAAVPRLRDRSPRQATGFEDQLAAARKRLGPSATPDEIMALLAEVAWSNPALAIDLADAIGQTDEERTVWIADLARQWARRQPQRAWDWLSEQQPSRLVDLATGTVAEVVVGTLAEGHPDLLVTNLDRLVHAGESGFGVAPVVAVHLGLEALAASGRPELARQAVEAWGHGAGRPPIGESAYLTAALAMNETTAEVGGGWLQSLPASEERDTALVELPAHWAHEQPRQALEWAEKHLPPHLRLRGLRRAFGEWVDRDPAEAAAWLTSYLARVPASIETDALVALLSSARQPPNEE
jgi:hypothetical protein